MNQSTTLLSFRPTSSERLAALLAHIGPIFAWILAPLFVYLLKRGESKYAEFHALQSLLWSLAGTITSVVTCGLAIPVFLVWHILAAIKTADGQDYRYPLAGDLAEQFMSGSR